jgi:hypothetical protein
VSRYWLAVAAANSVVLCARAGLALGPNGAPIDTSSYTLDLHEGPVIGSTRVVGLSGSVSPVTAGVEGYAINPASVALRTPWSRGWADWALDLSLSGTADITGNDFDNNGDGQFAPEATEFGSGGLGVQLGAWGIGYRVETAKYLVETNDGLSFFTVASLLRGSLVAGYAFADGQLAIGYGIDVYALELDRSEVETGGVSRDAAVQGLAVQFGAIWAPVALPLRVGLSARFPITDGEATAPDNVEPDASGNYPNGRFYVPREIRAPVELHAAVQWQWLRPLNVRWLNPHDATSDAARAQLAAAEPASTEPPAVQPRSSQLLLSAALKLTSAVQDGVGVESFFDQTVERSGERFSVSPRAGIEGEPLLDWLVLRAGSYLEPTRFRTGSDRWHATAGCDVHVPIAWSVFGLFADDTTFRVSGAVDAAERYFVWSVSAGIWR